MGGIFDEYLVVGWIKELFKTNEFKHLSFPPMYLIQLIVKRYSEEEIHWMYHKAHIDNRHFTISVSGKTRGKKNIETKQHVQTNYQQTL